MPRPSRFILALQKNGIHAHAFSHHDCPVDLHHHTLDHVARSGNKRDALLEQLRGHAGNTSELFAAALPRPKAILTSAGLRCSNFLRIAISTRPAWRDPTPPRLRAIVHAEVELRASRDWDPTDRFAFLHGPVGPGDVTLRILDVHVQPADVPEAEYLADALGWALSDQLLEHLYGLVNTLCDLDADYGVGEQLLRFRLQHVDEPFVAAVAEAFKDQLKDACQHGSHEVVERLGLEDEAITVVRVDVDDTFHRAIKELLSGRKPPAKPKSEKPAPNHTHHLLLRGDPVLRCSDTKVINLAAMASMHALADDARAQDAMDVFDLSEDEVDWGPAYDDRLARMKAGSKHEPLWWVFLVDEGTGVYAAAPVRRSELTLERVVELVDEMWRGEHGAIRGPSREVCLPTAYATAEARMQLEAEFGRRNVTLTAPKSGFATPLHVLKAWFDHSRSVEKHSSGLDRSRAPMSMSFQFVQRWALAHALADHACSHATSQGDRYAYFAFTGGGFGGLSTIRLAAYVSRLGLGDPWKVLEDWRSRCHRDFRSDVATSPRRRRAGRVTEHSDESSALPE